MNLNIIANILRNQRGAGNRVPPDPTTILTLVDRAIFALPTDVYTTTSRTTLATDGSVAKSFTERKNNNHVQWVSSDTIRKSYLTPTYGSRYDLTFPMYKWPLGDIPHVSFFNMFDVLMTGAFAGQASPFTVIRIMRRRRAVQDENMSPVEAIDIKENSNNTISIANSATGLTVVPSSTPMSEDVWTIVEVQDNGASSKLLYNNVQNGTNFTLAAGSLTQLAIGTGSHIYEHDVAAQFAIFGLLSAPNRTALYAAINAAYPIGTRVNKPYAHTLALTFDGVDTFNATASFNQGSEVLAANTALDEWEWVQISNTADVNGFTGLDAQKIILGATTSSLKRSSYPTYFPTPGNSNQQVFARLKQYNTAGHSWEGVPLRSQSILDNIVGTPDGTYAPKLLSVVVNDALKTRLVLTYTGGSGTLSNTSSNVADFTLYVEGVSVTINSISFPGGNVINIDLASALNYASTYTIPLRLRLTQGVNPLKDTNNKICESFITGIFVGITNNIVGPQTVKANLSWFNDTAASGWQNYTFDPSATGNLTTNALDILGVGTGVTIAVQDTFQSWVDNGTGVSSGTYPDVNITKRGFDVWQGGNLNGTLRLSGLGANKQVDIKLAIYRPSGSNGGLCTLDVIGGTTRTITGIDPTTLYEYDSTLGGTFFADASGIVDIKLTATASNKESALCAIIFTKYP